jgi:hypothetical protein|tara:strand:+ start:82 stop:408 length:327 start_codon:yes stop_codon:yes gene_type:complete
MNKYKFSFEIDLSNDLLNKSCKGIIDSLFKKEWFSIIEIDRVLEVLNIRYFKRSDLYGNFLRPLHCVHYKEMDKEVILKLKEICYKLIDEHKEKSIYIDESEFVGSNL